MKFLRLYFKSRWRKVLLYHYYLKSLVVVQVSLGFILGVIFSYLCVSIVGISSNRYFWLLGLAVSIINLCVFRKKLIFFSIFFLLGWLFLGSWYSPNNLQALESQYGRYVDLEVEALQVGELKEFNQSVVVTANDGDIQGKILLSLAKYPLVRKGEALQISGELHEPQVFSDFDYKEFLRSRNIHYTLEPIKVEYLNAKTSYQGVILEIKEQILRTIRQNQPEPQAALLSGLLLGTRENFSEELEASFRQTGTSHIVAVSGYNVTVVILLLLTLSGLLPRRFLYVFLVIALAIFIILIGWSNLPARRAVFMGYVLLTSWFTGRPSVIPLGVLYASVLMFLFNPLVWKDVSFQLSLSALLGILLFSKQLSSMFSLLPKLIRENFVPTAAVLAATLPVSISTFGSVSLVALPTNILVLPLVPLASAVGAVGVMTNFIPVLGEVINWLSWVLLSMIIKIVDMFAQFEFSSTDVQLIGWVMVAILIVFVLAGDLLQFRKRLTDIKRNYA